MKIGFIGAGKCGTSLADYFCKNGCEITGFYSRHKISGYGNYTENEIISVSDIVFITVNDTAILTVWKEIKNIVRDKIICHCSGAMSSDIFEGARSDSVCSVHPMLAFSSRHTDIAAIKNAFFTIEGGSNAVKAVTAILDKAGNKYKIIDKDCKAEYHAAACFASNFVVSVCEKAEQHLMNCGFTREEAHSALVPLMKNNMDNIISQGTHKAITGPAARGDMETIEKHLAVMGSDTEMYKLLTRVILDMKL